MRPAGTRAWYDSSPQGPWVRHRPTSRLALIVNRGARLVGTIEQMSVRPTAHDSRPVRTHLTLVSSRGEVARDDAELVAALRAGDRSAAGELWDRHSNMLRGLMRRMLGSHVDAEDAVQEVFLRFFDSVEQLQKPEALRSYLYGIGLRVARAEQRKRARRRWLPWHEVDQGVGASAPVPHDLAREPVARLEAILASAGDEARFLFVSRCVEKLELTEIASALDVSLSTAKRKLKRALLHIEKRVAGDRVLTEYLGQVAWGDKEP